MVNTTGPEGVCRGEEKQAYRAVETRHHTSLGWIYLLAHRQIDRNLHRDYTRLAMVYLPLCLTSQSSLHVDYHQYTKV